MGHPKPSMPSRPRHDSPVPPDFDCVVVGGGLVGAAAAVALSRQGCRVAVIEKRPPLRCEDPSTDMRALVLNLASQRILARIGLWDRLAGHVTRISEIHVSDQSSFGAVRLKASTARLTALGWACPADILRREFTEAMDEHVAQGLQWSTRFESCLADDGSITISTLNDGQPRSINARLLIGADGSDSSVRDALAIGVDPLDFAQTAIVANVEVDGPRVGTAYERFTPQGPLAMIPLGGLRYVSVQCLELDAAKEALSLDDDAYRSMLQQRVGARLGQVVQLGVRRAHELRRLRADRVNSARALIMGNAAATLHPNAAQGLNLGLRDVSALVNALAAARDPGAQAVTESYAAARASDHRRTVHFTDLLAQTFRSRLCTVTAGRRAAMVLTEAMPSLKRRLIIKATGLAALAREA